MAEITTENIARFKKAYNRAVKTNKTVFIFEGQEVLVTYAKYVIQYADSLKNKPKR